MKCKRIMSLLLALCLMLGVMVIPAMALEITNGVVEAANFYEAYTSSTNGHYVPNGIIVQENGDAYIILELPKNSTIKKPVTVTIEVDGKPTTLNNPDAEYVSNKTLTIQLKDDSKIERTSQNGFFIVSLGKLTNISTVFLLSADFGAGGWNFEGLEVHVNLNYSIQKTVDMARVDPGVPVVYTVTIKNTGDHTISGINVYDDVPTYLTIDRVAGQTELRYSEDRRLLLDEGISLAKNVSITYTIYATVSDKAPGETVITNTASIESTVLLPVEDQATVTVNPYFFVYHQATGKTDRIMMHQLDGTTFDITQPLTNHQEAYAGVTTNYLYGGIYTDSYGSMKKLV